ncbi:WD40 repeat domain-containing protein [Vairimorpha necatrix]|uniref:WD40 repeat domain-containing protein n=1 Tax=Vairimorpha necatrix TaxID=6039 RepID=A0AAX4JDP3_9MICR
MSLKPSKDFLEIFTKTLKKEIKIDEKDLKDAMISLLNKSNIKNFNEYIRTFQYRKNNINFNNITDKYKYLNFNYKHKGDLLGHSGQVERIAFDNTGKHVFSGGTDGMIKIWHVDTGFLINTCIGHRNMINDICFSKNGKLFVSCDFNGIINIWDLETLTVKFSIRLITGVTFAEFFEVKDKKNIYNLVVILTNGLVKVYTFDETKLINEKENDFTLDEPYKAICITDGGRFLLRAGYWPYLILIDTFFPEKCIIFDTNNLPVQTICAAKDCVKFAAGCGNWLFQWTFFYEGISSMGNFNRSSKILPGHWKKNVFKMDIEDNYIIDNMCYLKNYYLVCVCTDLKIRIYSERILRFTIQIEEIGVVCAHPLENIFAFYGQSLNFYFFDKLIFSEKLNFSINDCQFSTDGENFVVGDEMGNVRTYSVNYEKYKYKEQFFITDFEHFAGANDILFRECKNESTLDSNRKKNEEWRLLPYYTQEINNSKNIIIEEAALEHFPSRYLDKIKYRRKYCEFPEDPVVVPCEIEESTDSYDIGEDSSSNFLSATENDNKSSDEDLIIRRRASYKEPTENAAHKPVILRRNFVEPELETRTRGIRLRRNDNNEDEGLEFFHYQRQSVKRKKKVKKNEVPLISKLRRNVRQQSDDTIDLETSVSPKVRLRRHMSSED